MSRPYRGRGRGRGNDRFGYGRDRRYPYEQEYPRERDFPDRPNFRRDDVRGGDFRRDASPRGPRDGPRDGPREGPRDQRPWESRDRPPREPRERDPRERDPRDSPREFRDRPPSGPRERHDSYNNHNARPPPREPRGEYHRQSERDTDSPRHRPSSGNGSRHNSNSTPNHAPAAEVGTPKTNTNQGFVEAHLHLSLETTVPRASEPYHITAAQTESLQKRLNELEAFNQALEIADAKRRMLEAEYASVETDVVREGVRAEETSRALEVFNA